ncbi:atherin-like [Pogoniulus pusillus]|uniref:atherin-like n=1 Tax=Pogoniulus pusillus TaxID=488313 RepID=UPI0030B993E5
MAGRGPAPPAALIGCGCPAGGGTSAPARAPLPPLAHVAAAAAEQRSAPQALSSPGRQEPAGAGARHRPVRGALPRPPLCAPRVCQDWIIGRPRNVYVPVAEEDNKSASILPVPEGVATMKSKQRQDSPQRGWLRCFCVILILGLVTIGQAESEHHPHRPFR